MILLSREERPSLEEKTEEIKSKLREKLELIDTKSKTSTDTDLHSENDGIDYFELIYECVEKRNIFLNFIDLKAYSRSEPDIDLAILQALLNGKQKLIEFEFNFTF